MEFCTYILYSVKNEKIYIGQSSSIINRFHSHNSLAKKGWTITGRPWLVVHVEFFGNRTDALRREKELKSGKGRQWIKEFVLRQEHIIGFISA